ncbi:hypothetical protein [Aliarcobacter cryaerophilus]|uniref:hypothetical protein n=1 Tax=Aliarcobacter cryaerophilus TaxID=28198 RepID=UPI000826D433|nr:hypothetical protein [Aliarcobacter cryaerophilus]
MAKTVTDLKSIISSGANISIDASYTTTDIKALVQLAKSKGLNVTIRNASAKTTTDLKSIAMNGEKFVTFEL